MGHGDGSAESWRISWTGAHKKTPYFGVAPIIGEMASQP